MPVPPRDIPDTHGTYIWSLGSCCSSGAGKALQADLAPNSRGSFSSLCSVRTLGGTRWSTPQQGSQTPCRPPSRMSRKQEGQPVPGAPPPPGRTPLESPALAAPALCTSSLGHEATPGEHPTTLLPEHPWGTATTAI